MKYTKSTHSDLLKDGEMGKMRLTVDGEDPENIWVKRFTDYAVLQNHALNLFPFESWGVIIPSTGSTYDLRNIVEASGLELHPEAWEEYVKAGIINDDGSYIPINERPKPKQEEKS